MYTLTLSVHLFETFILKGTIVRWVWNNIKLFWNHSMCDIYGLTSEVVVNIFRWGVSLTRNSSWITAWFGAWRDKQSFTPFMEFWIPSMFRWSVRKPNTKIPARRKTASVFQGELFAAASDRSPPRDFCALGQFHFPAHRRSYLNGLHNQPPCPVTIQQIIILCSDVWQEKLATITKRAGVFLFFFFAPHSPRLYFPQMPAAVAVVHKTVIDFKTIWQRINKTCEEGGLSHELFDQSTCRSWN